MIATPTPARRADALALLAAMTFPALFTWVYFIVLRDHPTAVQQTVYTLGKGLQFAFPLVWVLLVRRARLGRLRPVAAGLGWGLLFGLAASVVILGGHFLSLGPAGALDAAGLAIRAKVARFGVDTPAGFVALGLFYALVHSLLEEYYWRWFVFGQLRAFVPLPAAIVVGSVAFAAHHALVLGSYLGAAGTLTWSFTAAVGVAGAVWCWLYQRSASLYGPWLSHALADAAIFSVAYALVAGQLPPT